MAEQTKSDEIKALLEKSARTIKVAEELLKLSEWDDASSRAYYGAFHAVQALLLYRDMVFSKHRGVIGAFKREFIRKGIFPKIIGDGLERLFDNRRTGDYDPIKRITSDQAREDVRIACQIYETVTKWLEKELEDDK